MEEWNVISQDSFSQNPQQPNAEPAELLAAVNTMI